MDVITELERMGYEAVQRLEIGWLFHCPFSHVHESLAAELIVNPNDQSWYCFGCQRHGKDAEFLNLITTCCLRQP